MLCVESVRKMSATDGSIIETLRTRYDDAGFGPAAIMELWGAADDLAIALGYRA